MRLCNPVPLREASVTPSANISLIKTQIFLLGCQTLQSVRKNIASSSNGKATFKITENIPNRLDTRKRPCFTPLDLRQRRGIPNPQLNNTLNPIMTWSLNCERFKWRVNLFSWTIPTDEIKTNSKVNKDKIERFLLFPALPELSLGEHGHKALKPHWNSERDWSLFRHTFAEAFTTVLRREMPW